MKIWLGNITSYDSPYITSRLPFHAGGSKASVFVVYMICSRFKDLHPFFSVANCAMPMVWLVCFETTKVINQIITFLGGNLILGDHSIGDPVRSMPGTLPA